jgi:hypothetical protein
MTSLLSRRRVLVAVLAGTALGAGVAAAGARDDGPERPRPGAAAPAPRDPDGVRATPVRGTVRLEARTADPGGGPPWTVRTATIDRTVVGPEGERRPFGRERCAQLGRLVGGRFGWIDADGRFAAVTDVNEPGVPGTCERRSGRTALRHVVLVRAGATPTPVRSVVFGLAAPGARRVDLRAPVGRRVRPGAGGGLLVFAAPEVRASDVRAVVRRAGGSPEEVAPPRALRSAGPDQPRLPLDDPDVRVEARAPDPSGGPDWLRLALPDGRGRWCVTDPSPALGDRPGTLDRRRGTFTDAELLVRCPHWPGGPTRRRPLVLFGGASTGVGGPGGPPPDPGRVELRTQPGRTIVEAFVREGAELVTIATPRDVRTLVPSPRASTVFAVYDGVFAFGEFRVTAEFDGGDAVTVRREAAP